MTLHEAIAQLLRQKGKPMKTQQIADELNKNKWYEKKDHSIISAFQIHGRTRNYPHLFHQDGSTISLVANNKMNLDDLRLKKGKAEMIAKSVKSSNHKKSFDPISNTETEILILGTMPGDKSFELGEYYAHSRNRFWTIISTITKSKFPINYAEKKSLLINAKIGIWDVAHKAERKGSLDAAIKDEIPNDLPGFIGRHKKLKVIVFNGTKSEALYDKYFDRKKDLKYYSLPSTSPANTSIDTNTICKVWKQILVN